jgi:hypothetical protein
MKEQANDFLEALVRTKSPARNARSQWKTFVGPPETSVGARPVLTPLGLGHSQWRPRFRSEVSNPGQTGSSPVSEPPRQYANSESEKRQSNSISSTDRC